MIIPTHTKHTPLHKLWLDHWHCCFKYIHSLLYLSVSWACWDLHLIWLTTHWPSVLVGSPDPQNSPRNDLRCVECDVKLYYNYTNPLLLVSHIFLIHCSCEPLRPVMTLLHSSLSTVSHTTSGNGRPHQSTISSTPCLVVCLDVGPHPPCPVWLSLSVCCLAYDIHCQITVASLAL